MVLLYLYLCAATVMIYMWKMGGIVIYTWKEYLLRQILSEISFPYLSKEVTFQLKREGKFLDF